MVAMASDSYLLKVPPTPCQARCRGGDQQSSTSCEVAMVVTLVVLVAGILSLAGTVFYLHMELGKVQAYTIQLEARLKVIDTKLSHLNYIEQLKAFENPGVALDDGDLSDLDGEEDDDEDDDFLPYYQDEESDRIIETRVRNDQEEDTTVQPLQPAGSLLGRSLGVGATSSPLSPGSDPLDEDIPDAPLDNHEVLFGTVRQAQTIQSPVQFPADGPEAATLRRRRDAQPAQQPQLRLYHMLQVPAAPPAESWSVYGSHRPQPMYAERAPTGFVTPPRPSAALLGTTPAAPIASRRSRVMDAEGAPRRHHQHRTGRRQRLQEVPQDVSQDPQDPQDVQRSVEVGRRRQQPAQPAWAPAGAAYEQRDPWRGPRRGVRSIDATVEVEQTWRPYAPVVEGPAIAAHFVGDSGRQRSSHHYDESGRLKHPTGEYADWRASDWVRELGLDHHFRLAEAGGHVTVDTPGLYFVYAQVNYANDKNENGYWVYRNGHKELLCAVTSAVAGSSAHANTCFTAGVLHLARGDRVSLRDLAGDRYRVLDHPGRSFIGLVNLSSCKLKQEPGRVAA